MIEQVARWQHGDQLLSGLFVGGELQRGNAEILATLLHEAAHGVAATRGIRDTSRQGRYSWCPGWANRAPSPRARCVSTLSSAQSLLSDVPMGVKLRLSD